MRLPHQNTSSRPTLPKFFLIGPLNLYNNINNEREKEQNEREETVRAHKHTQCDVAPQRPQHRKGLHNLNNDELIQLGTCEKANIIAPKSKGQHIPRHLGMS
jgi:hypothetical protein